MGSSFGTTVRVSLFGQSHSAAVGAVVDGLPAGEPIDFEEVARFMARRKGGKAWSTPRSEVDIPEVLGGLNPEGRTAGAPLALMIANADARPGAYENLRGKPRPGHADYTSWVRYAASQDPSGGGHFSGRLTAPLCAAGAVCKQILARRKVFVGAHLARLGGVDDARFDAVDLSVEQLLAPGTKEFPVIDEVAGQHMRQVVQQAHEAKDSVGGVVEVAALGLPAGVGAPMFDGLENVLARALFGIPAVKGVEFGAGFAASDLLGSQNNDPFVVVDGQVRTTTNNAGGINGGISNGMPIVARVAIKPTPSIGIEQSTVDLSSMQPATIQIAGRHDPAIAPRAVPAVEAVFACVLLDALLSFPPTMAGGLS